MQCVSFEIIESHLHFGRHNKQRNATLHGITMDQNPSLEKIRDSKPLNHESPSENHLERIIPVYWGSSVLRTSNHCESRCKFHCQSENMFDMAGEMMLPSGTEMHVPALSDEIEQN
jgi:hypothetical protein